MHILADTLGSVAVILSSVLIRYGGLYVADPICSFVVAMLIMVSAVPLLQNTVTILILGTDGRISHQVMLTLTQSEFEGQKLSVENVHVWQLTEGDHICSVKATLAQSPALAKSEEIRETTLLRVSTAVRSHLQHLFKFRPQNLNCQISVPPDPLLALNCDKAELSSD